MRVFANIVAVVIIIPIFVAIGVILLMAPISEPSLAMTPAPETADSVTSFDPAIHVKESREEELRFMRTYSAQITDEVRIEVERRTFLGARYDTSILTQRDGRWILFDISDPADKILDPDLLPIVERYCAEIIRLDEEYITSRPDKFTDETGQVWRRVSK